jgi:hypothetical protein
MANYYIHDSKDWVRDCSKTNASIVSTSSTVSDTSKYTASSPKTEIQIQEYISDLQTYIFELIRINPSLMNPNNANQISSDSTRIIYNQKGLNQNREVIASRNKPLCQLVADLNSLITTFNELINTSEHPYDMTTKNSIYTLYNDNINLRNDLQREIDKIYGKNSNSKLYLDSVVYTSVLWTILATTILFYIFKKL